MIQVAVVDDHPLFRGGVIRSLEEAENFSVVGEGASAADAMRLADEARPDILLLDISMPGNGLAALKDIVALYPAVKIVMLTISELNDDVMGALRGGASGYILKGVGSTSLCEILSGIAHGESYVSPTLAARLLVEMKEPDRGDQKDSPLAQLTTREEEILRLVADGLSNKEVAIRLDLQEKTVKHHMTHILSKLHVRNRTEAAIMLKKTEETN